MRRYLIAGVQMEVAPDIADNYPRILSHIAWAGSQGAAFCLFPEMSLTGYHGDFSQAEVYAALVGIGHACAEHEVTALVGTGWKEANETYIQVRVYSDRGEFVGAHSKLVPTAGDRKWCVPGAELSTFEHRGLVFGVLICNDLWVTPGCGPFVDPRLCYQLGRRGVDVVFHAVNSGAAPEYIPYHESNLQLRARESGYHIVTANAAKGEQPVNCSSGVVSPDGGWLVRVGRRREQRYVATVAIAQ